MSADVPGHLRWRSRRGMKEIDLLLERWLAHRFAVASSQERGDFERFLDLPDPDIARYLLGRESPPAEFRSLLAALLEPTPAPATGPA